MKYENGKIYRLVCKKTGKQYIGSTTQPLYKRKFGHKGHFNFYMNGKGAWCSSFEIILNNDYDIVLVEEYPCQNKEQLFKKEQEWIDRTECVNKVEYWKLYRERNKEYFKEYNKKRYEECDKEVKKRIDAEHYIQNKEKMLEKVLCSCGATVAKCGITRHEKTKKHRKQSDIIKFN